VATYNAIAKAKHATLVAATVDTVNFVASSQFYEVVNLSAADIYVNLDGTEPVVAGDDSLVVRAGEAATLYVAQGSSQVKLKSASGAEYHVAQQGRG
jgi:hypothetical protein